MREVDTIIAGGTILTLDERDTRIEDGALAIESDRIVGTGTSEEIKNQFAGRSLIDAKNCLVMPGLVNCHTHAAMTCFRGIADDRELMTWLHDIIFPLEAKHVDPELAYWGSLLACAEMIKSGTTTFCDMYVFEDETARAAKRAGMRCLLGEGLLDFPSPNAATPADGLGYTRKLIETWTGDPLVNIIVHPHSLYACSPSVFAEAKKIADEYNLPYALHLLENQAERLQLEQKFSKGVVAFLKESGYLTESFLAYHCVALDNEDISVLADHGCKAIHTPESNMKLGSGVAPVPAMLEAGMTVGLGTDGPASNNNLDMFREMDMTAKLHKVAGLDPTVMDARTVIRMATCEGANALGLGSVTGSLEPGKKADIIILNMRRPHLTPLYHDYSQLVYAAGSADVDTVIINGKLVMRNRTLLTINEKEVMAKVREIAGQIIRSLPA
ncbi:MAG: amidohydrolase [Deltaproteobacteria bacterium]|nr:amidohydrolase [Deltaproteobacteria bacterium]